MKTQIHRSVLAKMSWLKRKIIQLGQVLCARILTFCGLVFPRHVAVIMDGNRRFACRKNLATAVGHRKGFDKLLDIVKVCITQTSQVKALFPQWSTFLGVKELTVYAFSIENFKRSEEEVTALMDLAAEKFRAILDNTVEMSLWGVSVRLVGRSCLLPAELRILAAKLACATKDHPTLRLNIASPYTGRDEISRAASRLVDGVSNKELSPEDIDEELVTRTLDLGTPDLMIRTSGEVRLSDFMLWQVSNTVLYFTNVLWPQFTIWHFLSACIHYRKCAPALPNKLEHHNKRKGRFLEKLEKTRWREIDRLVAC